MTPAKLFFLSELLRLYRLQRAGHPVQPADDAWVEEQACLLTSGAEELPEMQFPDDAPPG